MPGSILLLMALVLVIFTGTDGSCCGVILVVMSMILIGHSMHVLRNPRSWFRRGLRRPLLVFAANEKDFRVYYRGSHYACRTWRAGHMADIGWGMFDRWTLSIAERTSGGDVAHVMSIAFVASKTQAIGVRDFVRQCIEAAHASVSHRELE